MATTYCGGERLIAGLQTQMNDKKGETFMSKKTRCRVLSLLLALVMVFGMVPMASASSAYNVKLTPTTPDESKLSTAIQQNKFKL